MKLHYYPETDNLYIELRSQPSTDSVEISDGLVVDLDDAGRVVGIDIDQAAERMDLTRVDTVALPVPA
ncbi:MAG: DUF2283 domain-containing protein [Chloroflexota bacterium]